jgi:hypothetical protein
MAFRRSVLGLVAASDHLRLDLALRVEGEQRVVDHVAVVADDVGGGPDRRTASPRSSAGAPAIRSARS